MDTSSYTIREEPGKVVNRLFVYVGNHDWNVPLFSIFAKKR
ncbi:hypothetical protein PC116_g25476 [Phytophthora cactorum]|uniref:Uncharacterized protein n=1 Tax=Phytophthora cactorum TaxID=29920 RepID=A0A8T1JW52_9STRA|nr:hypothetical protein Pcac1_g10036 [Phytophthora cactorum]KAG2877584.1 hypothetical protein PC114_g23546 [Phytophthora cactorum]KAG2894916.1 hypothetical protein PC117_g23363 [Phytophthora cactorum]KAG2991042.1 hypothetical protein PC120_g22788 [Phytophthora cactorum]KAG3130148.1 hypothetical protein C6341_g23867 [Phytophthora cactorum]